jgi:hypothetical protein
MLIKSSISSRIFSRSFGKTYLSYSLARSRERELMLSSGDVDIGLTLDMDEMKEAQRIWDNRKFEPDASHVCNKNLIFVGLNI